MTITSRQARVALACVGIAYLSATFIDARAGRVAAADRSAVHDGAAVDPQQPIAAAPASPRQALLGRYCVTCHNERTKTAGLSLDRVDIEHVDTNLQIWEKVAHKLRTNAMPPAGRPRPDPAAHDALTSWLESELDRVSAASPNPGRPGVHRLNRIEYVNTIRDLLAIEIDPRSLLPADDKGYGFDNIADVLSVSPGLLERYMSAARAIARVAVGDGAIGPGFETYSLSKFLTQDDRMDEDLPFGSRGGVAVRHHFPLDGDYVIKIRLQRNLNEEVRGLAETSQLDVRLDGARTKLFTIGGAHQAKGDEQTADERLTVRLAVKAGVHSVGVTFVKRSSAAAEGIGPARLPVTNFSYYATKVGNPSLDAIEIGGPYDGRTPADTPSRRRIFICQPKETHAESACARKILTTLARRAYRRPVSDEDVEPLLKLFAEGRHGKSFEAGIEMALRAMLVDPDFLFRIERDPRGGAPGTAHRIADIELASRLSFFLWSSIPDEELLSRAESGKLADPIVWERQVQRMLNDPRATSLVTNFAAQWLYLRNLREVKPDARVFPYFDDDLRDAFQRETELFLESTLREDRSVLDLLGADYTFLNERLARHYQIPNVYGSHFRRVTLADDQRRGLLGHASVLTVTSYATRTSPVRRGKWLLDNVLAAPPPAPPPNVPDLQDTGESGALLSVRERMEQHRANPVCASCHVRMDPLGFALENFDGIGRWRTTSEAGTPLDTSAVLPDGTKFDGPGELRRILMERPEEIATAVTEKLLAYALGRGLDYYDAPAIRKIVRATGQADYRWSSIIKAITTSVPFQMRMSRSAEPTTASR